MRSWWRLVLVSLVLLITVVLVFRVRTPFGKSNSNFAISWTDEIASIEIKEGDRTLLLNRDAGEWFVNNTFKARSSAIDFILKTIEAIEIKSPVSELLFDDLCNNSDCDPVLVTIRGKRRTITYFIYRSSDSSYETIMRRTLKSKPFFVSLPGYDYDPGSHFISDERFWMPYHIFNLNPDKIKSIKLGYKDPVMDDISIRVDIDRVELLVKGKPETRAKQEKLRRYISYFTFVPFETWVFDLDIKMKSELLRTEPEIEFIVVLEDDMQLIIRLWNKSILTPEGIMPDTDRLYGTLNGGSEIFVAKYFDLDPLIKTVEYFISD